MKKTNLLLFTLLFVTNSVFAQSTVGFEGQSFGTSSWTENDINWVLGGWANIRSYSAHTGSNHGMLLNNNYLEGDHNINVNSLWIYVQSAQNNTYVDFKGYNSSGTLIKTQRYNSPSFMFDYAEISLTGFSSITKLVIEYDDDSDFGDVSIFMDDVNYNDLGALPVELTSFDARIKENNVLLTWQTATEINNHGFEVQRSAVSGQPTVWEKIGFVQGAGNSNSPKNYSFIDQPTGGTTFSYRLKQIDNDGKYKIYDAITVELSVMAKAELMQNSPNPFNPSTSIKFYIPDLSSVNIKIYDILGKEVNTLINEQTVGGYHIVYWNGKNSFGENASSGVYLYRLEAVPTNNVNNKFIETKKMILLK